MPEQTTLPGVTVIKITTTRLNEIKHRVYLATKGPWKAVKKSDFKGENWPVAWSTGVSYTPEEDTEAGVYITTDSVHASELDGDALTDAEFMAHARTDIPDLVEEVERLRAVAEAQREVIEALERIPEIEKMREWEKMRMAPTFDENIALKRWHGILEAARAKLAELEAG